MLYDRFRTQPSQNPMMSSGPRFIAPIPQPGALQAQQNAQTQQMMQDVMSLVESFSKEGEGEAMALPGGAPSGVEMAPATTPAQGNTPPAVQPNIAQATAMTPQPAMGMHTMEHHNSMPSAATHTMEVTPEMYERQKYEPEYTLFQSPQAQQEAMDHISPYIEEEYDPDPLGLNHPNLVMPSDLGYKLPSGRSPRGPQVGQEKSYDRYMGNKINQGLENIRQLDMAAEQAGIIPQGSVEQMWGQVPQASAAQPGFQERAADAINQAGQAVETQATNAWNGMKDAAHQYYQSVDQARDWMAGGIEKGVRGFVDGSIDASKAYYQGADQARDWAAKQIEGGIKYGVDGMQNVASTAIQGIVDTADFAGENAIYASYKVGETAAKQIDKIGPEQVMNTLEHVVPATCCTLWE